MDKLFNIPTRLLSRAAKGTIDAMCAIYGDNVETQDALERAEDDGLLTGGELTMLREEIAYATQPTHHFYN